MSCTDKNCERLLHAYELGILSPNERNKFERHLIECDHCAMEVEQFQALAGACLDDPEIRTIAERLASTPTDRSQNERAAASPRTKRTWRRVLPTLAAAAVLLLLLLKDWQLEFRPSQEAVAMENRLAIMYFGNLAEPDDRAKLGEITTDLLITDLSESGYMQVMSGQHLYDLLKLLGHEGAKKIDPSLADDVARKAKARWMLTGNILQVEPHLIVTSQLVDVASGDAVAAQRITGKPGETIFSLVDDLTVEIKKDMALPARAQEETDPQVASITTNSLEAYRSYLEAREYYYKAYFPEAAVKAREAIQYDSTFAMAYAMLGTIAWLTDRSELPDLVSKAVSYVESASTREKWWIKALEAFAAREYTDAESWLGEITKRYPDNKGALYWQAWFQINYLRDPERGIWLLKRAVEVDPLFKMAYGLMGRAYEDIGESEMAMESIDRYIDLAPDEAYPYARRGDIFKRRGDVAQAIASYELSLSKKADFEPSLRGVVELYMFVGDYQKAEQTFRLLSQCNRKGWRSDARTGLALVPLCQGKLTEALAILDDGIGADRLENATDGDDGDRANKHWLKGWIYLEQNNLPAALDEFDHYTAIIRDHDPESIDYGRFNIFELLADAGAHEDAQQVYQALMRDIGESGDRARLEIMSRLSQGILELSEREPDAAVHTIGPLGKASRAIQTHYWLGKAYLAASRYEEAAREFISITESHNLWRFYNGLRAVRCHYLAGLAYESSGHTDEAIGQYQRFIKLWEEADPELNEVQDAQRRLSRLMDR